MFNFKENLRDGLKFEELFYHSYYHPDVKLKWNQQAYYPDFTAYVNENEKLLELKTDKKKYNNFFFEKYSNVDTQRLGGPYSALDYGADYFLYWFVGEKNQHQWECYFFRTKELVEYLKKNEYKYQIKTVKNKTYVTSGHIVPIVDIQYMDFVKIKTIAPTVN